MSSLIPLFLLAALTSTALAQLPVEKPIPDVTAYDAEGKAFPLQEKMKGHYSVIVFGCLT